MSLYVAEATLRLQLSPAYLGDVDAGIREQLNASLLQHVAALGGVVLAYDRLTLLDGYGCIRNDLPDLHVPVSLRILVFAPRVGDTLTGVVRRQGTDHTALLVHGMFSAAVSSAQGRAEGESLRFVVRSLQVTDGLLSIVGERTGAAAPSSPHHGTLAAPSGSSPLRVKATRPAAHGEAVGFFVSFLEQIAALVLPDVLKHMQTVRDALEEEQSGAPSGTPSGAAGASASAEEPAKKKKKKKDRKDAEAAPPATNGAPKEAAAAAGKKKDKEKGKEKRARSEAEPEGGKPAKKAKKRQAE